MRTLYIEGVAIRGGPESCVGVPRGRSEALTGGVRAGLLSREITNSSGCRRALKHRKATLLAAFSRVAGGPCAVGDPRHVRRAPCARTGRSRGRPSGVDDAPFWMVRGVA